MATISITVTDTLARDVVTEYLGAGGGLISTILQAAAHGYRLRALAYECRGELHSALHEDAAMLRGQAEQAEMLAAKLSAEVECFYAHTDGVKELILHQQIRAARAAEAARTAAMLKGGHQ